MKLNLNALIKSANLTFRKHGPEILTFVGVVGLIGTTVAAVKVTPAEACFRFRPALSGIPDGLLPDFIEAPHIAIPLDHELFQPFSEGVIVGEWEKRNRKVQHIEFPDNLGIGYYPGLCQMQFLAAWRNEGGICFIADDPRHTTKALEFAPEAGDRLGLRIETMCGGLLRSGRTPGGGERA